MKRDSSFEKLDDNGIVWPFGITKGGQISLFPACVAKTAGPVSDSTYNININESKSPLDVDDVCYRRGPELPFQARVMLTYNGVSTVTSKNERLTEFDKEVIDAVASLFIKPKQIIRAEDICRAMVGKGNDYKVTPNMIQLVIESIEKCQFVCIKIQVLDYNQVDSTIKYDLANRGFRTGTLTGYMIPCETLELQTDDAGQVFGIKLLSEPTLFLYSKLMGQLSVFPLILLDTPTQKTERNIILQSYLIRTIDKMYRSCEGYQNWIISTDDIYATVNCENLLPNTMARIRKTTTDILDYWVRIEYIKGYTTLFQGPKRRISGYEIELYQEKKEKRYWNLPENLIRQLPAAAV